MFTEWAISKALDLAFEAAKDFLSGGKTHLACTREDVEAALSSQQQGVQRWCEEISFTDLKHVRSTVNVYVALNVFLLPRSVRVEPDESVESRTLDSVLTTSREHVILLGQPGAGKSTSMKYICHRLMHEEAFLPTQSFPVVVRFRDLNLSAPNGGSSVTGERVIIPAIANLFGLSFRTKSSPSTQEAAEEAAGLADSVVLLFLEQLKPLIVLDGLDELSSQARRQTAIHELRALTRQLSHARVVLTSRTGDFPYQIDNAGTFEICSLTKAQIRDFAHKWLADETRAEHLIEEISHSPFADTAIKPLTLAHLCAIYERLGRIPDKPKTVYRKIVNLLIDEWDEQRSVIRQSRYAGFSPDRKFDFLCRLAYELTVSQTGAVFRLDDLRLLYRRTCEDFDLLPGESRQVLAELESHTGLFVQAGYHAYEFVHRSLQEYLTAEYIKGLPSLPSEPKLVTKIPNELAIAVSISTNPSTYLIELVMTRLRKIDLPSEFFTAFVARLLQEKPEFNTQEEVLLALLVLYGLYLEGAPVSGQQVPLILFDNLATQFERLLDVVAKRNPREVMLSYYARQGTRASYDGSTIVILEKRKDSYEIQLPAQLYARENFFHAHDGPATAKACPN